MVPCFPENIQLPTRPAVQVASAISVESRNASFAVRASIFIETSPRGSCTGDFGERETRQGGGGTRFLRTCSSDWKTPKAGRDRAVVAEAPRPLCLPALLSELS